MTASQPTAEHRFFNLPVTGQRDGRNGVVVAHALVQDDDFTHDFLRRFRWSLRSGYPRSKGAGDAIGTGRELHHVIYVAYHGPIPEGLVIDHINQIRLDARPGNLRAIPQTTNAVNRPWGPNRAGYRGVSVKPYRRWQAAAGGEYLGLFRTPEDAARAVNAAYRRLYPEQPSPNPEVELPDAPGIELGSVSWFLPLPSAPVLVRPDPIPDVYFLPMTGRRDGQRTVVGFVKVADDDFTRNVLAWHFWNNDSNGYAVRRGPGGKRIHLHRIVYEHYQGAIPPGLVIDHDDRNKANCLPGNLFARTQSINMANVGHRTNNTSGFHGVCRDAQRGCWLAKVKVNRKTINLGRYITAREAADAVNQAYQRYFPDVQMPNPQVE